MEIKTKQITVLFLSMFIFTLGFSITVPVMPYFAKSMGGSVIDVGLLMAAYSAMELIFAPIWGKISDIIGRKPVILIGLMGFTVAFAAAGISSQLWMLYASQIVAGALAAGLDPAAMALHCRFYRARAAWKIDGPDGSGVGAWGHFRPRIVQLIRHMGITHTILCGSSTRASDNYCGVHVA